MFKAFAAATLATLSAGSNDPDDHNPRPQAEYGTQFGTHHECLLMDAEHIVFYEGNW